MDLMRQTMNNDLETNRREQTKERTSYEDTSDNTVIVVGEVQTDYDSILSPRKTGEITNFINTRHKKKSKEIKSWQRTRFYQK